MKNRLANMLRRWADLLEPSQPKPVPFYLHGNPTTSANTSEWTFNP